MPISEESAYAALRQVQDPELLVNIVDLGLVYEVRAVELPDGRSRVEVKMTMTSPACPAAPQLIGDAKRALSAVEGVAEVDVELVMSPAWSPERMSEDARDELGMF